MYIKYAKSGKNKYKKQKKKVKMYYNIGNFTALFS